MLSDEKRKNLLVLDRRNRLRRDRSTNIWRWSIDMWKKDFFKKKKFWKRDPQISSSTTCLIVKSSFKLLNLLPVWQWPTWWKWTFAAPPFSSRSTRSLYKTPLWSSPEWQKSLELLLPGRTRRLPSRLTRTLLWSVYSEYHIFINFLNFITFINLHNLHKYFFKSS